MDDPRLLVPPNWYDVPTVGPQRVLEPLPAPRRMPVAKVVKLLQPAATQKLKGRVLRARARRLAMLARQTVPIGGPEAGAA